MTRLADLPPSTRPQRRQTICVFHRRLTVTVCPLKPQFSSLVEVLRSHPPLQECGCVFVCVCYVSGEKVRSPVHSVTFPWISCLLPEREAALGWKWHHWKQNTDMSEASGWQRCRRMPDIGGCCVGWGDSELGVLAVQLPGPVCLSRSGLSCLFGKVCKDSEVWLKHTVIV